jgi:hypothetical protein
MPYWIIQYVYEDKGGDTRVSHIRIKAENEAEARSLAPEKAPTEEFLFSIHPETAEQVLGTIRRKAAVLTGKATSFPHDAPIPDEEEDEDEDGEEWEP